MGLVLDEPVEKDTVFSSDSVTVLADETMKDEIKKSGGIKMEYINDPMRGSGIILQFAKPAGCSSSGCSC